MELKFNDEGLMVAYAFGCPVYVWTYDDFQLHAGPYRVTPSVYTFMAEWLRDNMPPEALRGSEYRSVGTEHDAVQAYFSLPFIEHEIMHNQTMANLEMTRAELLKSHHEYIAADVHMQNMDFPKVFTDFALQLIRNIEHKIRLIEGDITDERNWSSYY